MEDETDLSALSALDLDDSNEDFWKMDNVKRFGSLRGVLYADFFLFC